MALNFFKIARGLFLTPQSTTPTSPADGDTYFDSVLNKFQFRENGAWKGLGSGSAGINYITNPDADTGTTGWIAYKDAAGVTPVSGTGPSPTHITLTTSATSPLRGTNSFIIANSGASSAQGEGISFNFTIDNADQAKQLDISFDYMLNSGTFKQGSQGPSLVLSDLVIYILDVTNNRLIQPAPFILAGGVGTGKFKYQASFQTSVDSTSYRLIMHVPTTTTTAWSLKFDNVVLGPQSLNFGAPITDWQTFVPTGSWNANVTYAGKWRRVGSEMEVRGTMTFTGASTAGNLILNLPSGYTIDLNQLPTGSPLLTKPLGEVIIEDASGGVDIPAILTIASNTSMVARYILNNDGSNRTVYYDLVTAAAPITGGMGNGDVIEYVFNVPIVGWGSNVVMSSDASTRIVAASAYFSSGLTKTINPNGGVYTEIAPDTVVFDTHGAYNSSTGRFTAPVPGYYRVSYNFTANTVGTLPGEVEVAFLKNGTGGLIAEQQMVPNFTSAAFAMAPSAIVYLNVGDYVSCFAHCGSNSVVAFGGVGHQLNQFSVERIAGPETIAASEKVNLMYYRANAFSLSSSPQTPTFTQKAYDTHNAWDSINGIFTAPMAGKYRFTVAMQTSATASSANNAISIGANNNGNGFSFNVVSFKYQVSGIVLDPINQGSITFEMKAGDTAQFVITASVGVSGTVLGNDNNFIMIEKVD